MGVFRGSRYTRSKRYSITRESRDGTVETREFIPPPDLSDLQLGNDFRVQVVRDGDELDGISYSSSGYSIFWWLLAYFSGIDDPFDVDPGTEVVIPSFNVFSELG